MQRTGDVHGETSGGSGTTRIRHAPPPVVVGVDSSTCSMRAVAAAAVEAERLGAPLRVVHAAPAGSVQPDRVDGLLDCAARVAVYSTTRADTNLVVTLHLRPEPPAAALLAESMDAALVVVGHSRSGTGTPGPVATRLGEVMPERLVVVRPPPAAPSSQVPAPRADRHPIRRAKVIIGLADPL